MSATAKAMCMLAEKTGTVLVGLYNCSDPSKTLSQEVFNQTVIDNAGFFNASTKLVPCDLWLNCSNMISMLGFFCDSHGKLSAHTGCANMSEAAVGNFAELYCDNLENELYPADQHNMVLEAILLMSLILSVAVTFAASALSDMRMAR